MKSPSFQARFAALLTYVSLLEGRGFHKNSFGQMSLYGGAGGPFLPPGSSGVAGGAGASLIHKSGQTTGVGGGVPSAMPAGSYLLSSTREVAGSLASISLPVNMYLQDVCVEGDDGPGTFEIGYAASNNAHFVAAASGLDATGLISPGATAQHIPVSWYCPTVLPSATFTANGDLLAATLTFSTSPAPNNPDISSYRAMWYVEAFADTTTDTQVITFDAGSSVVKAAIVLHAVASGSAATTPTAEVDILNSANYTQEIISQGPASSLQLVPVQPLAPSLTISVNQTVNSLGSATTVNSAVLLFY